MIKPKKKVSKKRKNPADSTMRNVRACNKRLQFLEHRINTLCAALNDLRNLEAVKIESMNLRLFKLEERSK